MSVSSFWIPHTTFRTGLPDVTCCCFLLCCGSVTSCLWISNRNFLTYFHVQKLKRQSILLHNIISSNISRWVPDKVKIFRAYENYRFTNTRHLIENEKHILEPRNIIYAESRCGNECTNGRLSLQSSVCHFINYLYLVISFGFGLTGSNFVDVFVILNPSFIKMCGLVKDQDEVWKFHRSWTKSSIDKIAPTIALHDI